MQKPPEIAQDRADVLGPERRRDEGANERQEAPDRDEILPDCTRPSFAADRD
jgi:hypothetical protein